MKIRNSLLTALSIMAVVISPTGQAAAPFSPEAQPLGYISPVELDTTDLTNGAKAYRIWFENGAWQGDLVQYDVSSDGVLSTSIDLSDIQPRQTPGGNNWSAHVRFSETADTSSHWNTGRKIITTTDGTDQVAFRWDNLTDTQKEQLDSLAFDDKDASSDILDFVRGDRSNETPNGTLRLRYSVLLDIVHSNPEYVGQPDGEFTENFYPSFKNANENRAPTVYVGSNSGMLHAFNADTGQERWAYVPNLLMHKLSRLAGTPYAHTYYVDGGLTVRDAYFDGNWNTVLASGLGAGGKGMFALNVTDPSLTSEALANGSDKKVMWELSADADDDVGYIFGQPTIAQLNDGRFYVITGNGVSSVNGRAKLLLIDVETGAVTALDTGEGSNAAPNGLSAPALVDLDGDLKVDVAWAGDIDGNMWRFDLTSASPGSWDVEYRVWAGLASQPITTAPDIANHPNFGHLVIYGTGRLYTDDDLNDNSVQALFGLWDKGTAPAGGEVLYEQTLSADTNYSGGGYTETIRTVVNPADVDYVSYDGWFASLPAGHRVLTPAQIRAGRIKATVTEPSTLTNWVQELTIEDGSAEEETIYDLNRDRSLDELDRVLGNNDVDYLDPDDIPMGWQRETGAMSEVTIANLENGVDTLYLNFLNPPIVPAACTGTCAGGLAGGHMDVDTDDPDDGLGGGTNGHVHEYDDDTNRTYVDFFDIIETGKLTQVDQVGIGANEKFILVVANADMSPGAIVTINNREYSAVYYQRMIQDALADWDGTSDLLDESNQSLIFTVAGLNNSFQTNLDNQAIIAGGLIPTNTGCVNKDASITNGRWRNGAYTIQLIKASHFAGLGAGESALDRVIVQEPVDHKDEVVLSNGTQVRLSVDHDDNGTVENTTGNYEIYGGIVAADNDEFLFESTLFWHWDPGECYGDSAWEEEFKLATEGVPEEVYEEMLDDAGYASFEELVAEVQALQACLEADAKDKDCKKDLEKLEDLYNMGLLVEATKNKNNGNGAGGQGGVYNESGSGTSTANLPSTMGGGVDDPGLTSGPNFEAGRRTWIDIMPE